ncbi:MAG: lytic transglycosylase domain-containing protein [Gemmatimonadetes bacterium]|nr:lytic transglycosylase domain-containing protein [Gemmatimonadota bacterium]MDA1102886.1 lytic transglycosylase domain-containing protein [Gemmatimonadota bacterium]
MSTIDLRGPLARVDRWDSQEESQQVRRVEFSRPRWLGSLMVAPLLAVPILWFDQDPVLQTMTLDAVAVGAPALAGIPLDVNPKVQRWLEAFQTTRRPELDDLLQRRGLYGEMIRGKLRERGMPEELVYIPMVESGLSPLAVSRVSAVGLWQFMSPTATQYGLRLDEYVDERRDPVRATDAALDYLEWLYGRFGGSWYLAAAAYNAGPGRVERVLNRHAGGRMGNENLYWEILEYLPRETREYIPKLVAVTLLANAADVIGVNHDGFPPYRYENVFVPGGTTLKSVASALGIGVATLRTLNPHLTLEVTPPGEMFGVRIPLGGGATVVKAMARVGRARRTD